MAATGKNGTATKNGAKKNGAAKNGTTKSEPAKKTVLAFTAEWVPQQGEKADAGRSFFGIMQVVNGKPTDLPAHVVLRDYDERAPYWWPGVTIPAKKQVSYGALFDDEQNSTNLHAITIAQGAAFWIKTKDGDTSHYQIVKVEDLTG